MARQTVGIVMNGVTGRMGTTQHLVRSIIAIREQGGIPLDGGDVIWPEPLLVGRSEHKLEALAREHGLQHHTTDLDAALAEGWCSVYFDAQATARRAGDLERAIEAGKHVYSEKPTTDALESALDVARQARDAGVKNGVVHDKLFLPGFLKLRRLIESGFFGRILSVRGEFGYWVFEGFWQEPQRPSWNYRREDGGGMLTDMFCHWRYVLDNVFAPVRAVSCIGATHIPERVDEQGRTYRATADDAAYGTFELDGGIIAQINSSWAVRVHRDELFVLQVDGTDGSAVAGLQECRVQPAGATPRPTWNPDEPNLHDFYADWLDVPANGRPENAFKAQWEMFLRHVVTDAPYEYDLLEGAKGIQLAELGERSWRERRWLDVPELTL